MDHAQELGARDGGAELGASINGAELRVHFLNSFRQGSICEKLSKKRANIKNSDKREGAKELVNGRTHESCRPPALASTTAWLWLVPFWASCWAGGWSQLLDWIAGRSSTHWVRKT